MLALFTDLHSKPFEAKIKSSILFVVSNSAKAKKGSDGEREWKRGREGGRKQGKLKRKSGRRGNKITEVKKREK